MIDRWVEAWRRSALERTPIDILVVVLTVVALVVMIAAGASLWRRRRP